MKKIKLTTSALKIKKEEIANLSKAEMRHVYGGDTGPCATSPCNQNTSQGPECITGAIGCPSPSSPGGQTSPQITIQCK